MRDSVAADPSDTTLLRRTILSDTIRVDGRTCQHSRRTTGTDYWDIHSDVFPIVSSASFSLLALFQTLRRHWCRLLRQRLFFSIPSRVVVTSAVLGNGKHWSRSDCRANNPVAGKARNRDSWHSLARGHGLCPGPLPRGKTLEKKIAERVRRLLGESHGHSVFAFFLHACSVRKNVLFSEFLVSHTTSRQRLTQTVSYHFSTQLGLTVLSGPLSSDAENRLHASRLLVQCCSEDRRVPTDAVLGQVDDKTTGAWS